MKSRLLLAPIAVGLMLAASGPAHAADARLPRGEDGVAIGDNWIDNAAVPIKTDSTGGLLAAVFDTGEVWHRLDHGAARQSVPASQSELLRAAAMAGADILRFIADSSNS